MKPDRIPFSVRIQPYHKSRIMQIATKLKKTHGEVIEQLLDLAAEQLLKTPHDAPWMNSCQGRDPKFYTARTKRAVNSLTVERGPKAVPHE